MRNKLAKKIKKELLNQLYRKDIKAEIFEKKRTNKSEPLSLNRSRKIHTERGMTKDIYSNDEFKSINRAKRKNIKRHIQKAKVKRSRRQKRLAKWRRSQWD